MVGHQLAEAIDLTIAHLQDPPAVAQHGAGLHLAESDDLRDAIGAIFGLHIADHFAAPGFAEVDVEVRHRDAFGVQKAFEQQPQPDRIKVGDGQRPGHHAARARPAPRPDRNALRLGPLDEVGHDQEVAGKAHPVDDPGLELQPLEIARPLGLGQLAVGGQPRLQASARGFDQHRRLAFLVAGKAGQQRLAARRGIGTAARDNQRIGQRLGAVGKQLGHHRRGLDPVLRAAAWPVRGVHMGRRRDAQHGVMRLVELRLAIARGVGGNQRQTGIIGQPDQRRFRRAFDGITAPRQFDVEPAGEQRLQPRGIGLGRPLAPIGQQPRQRPLARPGQADQPVGMAFERLQSHMGVELDRAIKVRGGHQMAQVQPAGLVLGIERQPVDHRRAVLPGRIRPGHRQQSADDRLDALVETGAGKSRGAVQPVAVGHGNRGESPLLRQLRQRLGLDRPFQHRIAREDTQRHEGLMSHGVSLAGAGRFGHAPLRRLIHRVALLVFYQAA